MHIQHGQVSHNSTLQKQNDLVQHASLNLRLTRSTPATMSLSIHRTGLRRQRKIITTSRSRRTVNLYRELLPMTRHPRACLNRPMMCRDPSPRPFQSRTEYCRPETLFREPRRGRLNAQHVFGQYVRRLCVPWVRMRGEYVQFGSTVGIDILPGCYGVVLILGGHGRPELRLISYRTGALQPSSYIKHRHSVSSTSRVWLNTMYVYDQVGHVDISGPELYLG